MMGAGASDALTCYKVIYTYIMICFSYIYIVLEPPGGLTYRLGR